jgi:hypothetical protein
MLAGKTDYTVKQGLNPAKYAASAPILHRFMYRLPLPCCSRAAHILLSSFDAAYMNPFVHVTAGFARCADSHGI